MILYFLYIAFIQMEMIIVKTEGKKINKYFFYVTIYIYIYGWLNVVECANLACKEPSLVGNMVQYYSILEKDLILTNGVRPSTTMFFQVSKIFVHTMLQVCPQFSKMSWQNMKAKKIANHENITIFSNKIIVFCNLLLYSENHDR